MPTLATVAVTIVAIIHILISVVEIFFLETPLIYERLGFTAEVASQVAPIVQNAGLYNGFIAAGLLWSVFAKEHALPLRTFFLACVSIRWHFWGNYATPDYTCTTDCARAAVTDFSLGNAEKIQAKA